MPTKKFMYSILICIGIISGSALYLALSKENFCKNYALKSYQYGMAESEEKARAYADTYNYCAQNYLKVRLQTLIRKN